MKSAVLLLFALHAMQLLGQSVQGTVVDAATGEGIPFAHVVPDSGKGAITDLYGQFELETVPTGTLTISCLGYNSKTVQLKTPERHNSGRLLVISLEQNIIELDEVIVTPEDPEMLLQEAFRKIPENYDSAVSQYSGYYRLSANLQDKNIRYKEAFIDLIKFPYNIYSSDTYIPKDSMVIRESRIRPNEISDWKINIMLPWERSIYFLNFRDVVKDYITMDDADKQFFRYYDYEIKNMVLVNGRRTYKIEMHPKRGPKKAYWNGHIYLDEESLAFVKFDLVSREKALKVLKSDLGYIISSKLYNVKYNSAEWKESISYRKIGDKWYFDEVNSSKFFLLSSKKREIEEVPAKFNLHYKTGSVELGVRIDTMEFLAANLPSHKEDSIIASHYDSTFWQQFDRVAGNPKDTITYSNYSFGSDGTKEYIFSRLDTLQGALTPIREAFDVTYYRLDVEVVPEEEVIQGSSTIHFHMTGEASELQIDLFDQLAIDSIIYNGYSLEYEREYNAVFVKFSKPLKVGTQHSFTVYYRGRPVDIRPEIPMYGAFIWAEDRTGIPWFQAICQGYGASGWWPVKDHLSDEPDSASIRVTVPRGLDVISNGRLRHKSENGDKTSFEWFVSYPINNYNITLNAGKYTEINDYYLSNNYTLDLQYFVLPYHKEIARNKLEIVKPMLSIYEKYFGKYPFAVMVLNLWNLRMPWSIKVLFQLARISFGRMPPTRRYRMKCGYVKAGWISRSFSMNRHMNGGGTV